MESYQNQVENIAEVSCENCDTKNSTDKKFCTTCSFPIAGAEEDKRSFRLVISSRKRLLSDAADQIKSAKIVIYVLAGIFFLSGMIAWFSLEDLGSLVVNLCISLLYLIFAAWCSKNPFGAILTASLVYVTVQILNAFVDPTTIVSGIILKIVVIAAFVKGIRSAMDAQNYMKELEKFKSFPVGNY